MKLSRDWLNDFIDLADITDEQLAVRFPEIGHAVDAVEKHGHDTVFDLEITTNRVDAMSHLGMARELAAAFAKPAPTASRHPLPPTGEGTGVKIRIEVPEMCSRYTALVIHNVVIKQSPEKIRRRLEAVGLRPINNVVDATNYTMLAMGHPLHGFDLDKLSGKRIVVRAGKRTEKIRTLDGETREIDPETVIIADGKRAVALGGIIGGAESEITESTQNVLLECAWFNPAVTRRTARRLGIKTDASYRFERRVDPNDTILAVQMCAEIMGTGTVDELVDVIAREERPKTIRVRARRMQEASAGVVGAGYALEILGRLGFEVRQESEGLEVTVPTYRGDIHEEADLIEEVLRFYGLNRVPALLPRLTTGDTRPNVIGEVEDRVRELMVGCGLTEVVNYSFIPADYNALVSSEQQVAITNALTENIGAMRLSLIPGLLDSVVFNRSYGTRDGALFEVGRTYHRAGDGVREHHRVGMVLFGSVGSFWGDPRRAVDFFDIKGIVEQVAARHHVTLRFDAAETTSMKEGRRAVARSGERPVATMGFLSAEVLQRFGIKGEVAAAEIDLEALLAAQSDWKMAPVTRFPGVPMIMALLHGPDLTYQRLVDTIRSLKVPYLYDVGLRDRFVPDGAKEIKTTLGMWYQAFDRSLTQEEVGQIHQQIAKNLTSQLPVKLIS
jgi:phenylalanyl-tRNA synthetase beta chain